MNILTLNEVKRLIASVRDVFAHLATLRKQEKLAQHIQNPKIPTALSQALAAHLLESGRLLGQRVKTWPSTERGDLCGEIAGGIVKIEVKATGEKGFQELGRKDLEAGLLIWLHFGSYFRDPNQRAIEVCLMAKPSVYLKESCKLSLKKFRRVGGENVFGLSVDLEDLFEADQSQAEDGNRSGAVVLGEQPEIPVAVPFGSGFAEEACTMATTGIRSTLIQSGPATRARLKFLQDELQRFGYAEAKYYASFRSHVTCRSFAKLNPQKKAIRLFVRLKASEDPDLTDTPATQGWADYFPSFFKIRSERDLIKAKLLIEMSGAEDNARR